MGTHTHLRTSSVHPSRPLSGLNVLERTSPWFGFLQPKARNIAPTNGANNTNNERNETIRSTTTSSCRRRATRGSGFLGWLQRRSTPWIPSSSSTRCCTMFFYYLRFARCFCRWLRRASGERTGGNGSPNMRFEKRKICILHSFCFFVANFLSRAVAMKKNARHVEPKRSAGNGCGRRDGHA